MRSIFRYFLIFSTLFISLSATAQKISFESSAPLNVLEGDRFRVEFVLNNATGSSFTAPTFTGATVLAGPTMSSGTSISIINGTRTQATTETYTYFIETQSGVNKIAISAAKIEADGKTYSSRPLSINVMSAGSQQGTSSTGNSGSSATTNSRPNSGGGLESDDILLRMELSKKECFKGEAVSAQLKLYTRVGISAINDAKYAAFNGFWTVEIESAQNPQPTRATINGKVYESFVIRQWLLYPQKAGTMEIEQTSIKALAQIVTRASGNSLFDQFFGGGSQINNVEKSLTTGTTRLVVKPLPAGAPVGLNPAVGSFKLSSKLSSESISANSAGSLTVTLDGSGDFPLIETPDFKLPAEFEQYDTKTNDKLRSSLSGQSGSRSWEFPFIARSEGQYTIPSVEIAYFDPATKKYTTLKTPEYQLEVTRDTGASGSGLSVVSGVSKEDLKMLGQDIRYIKTTPLRASATGSMLLYSTTFFITLIVIAIAIFVLLLLFKQQAARRADVVGSKNRKASKVAIKRLKMAKRQLDNGSRTAFFEEMLRAMWGFVGDKFAIEVSELNKGRIEREFATRGINKELGEQFIALIEECEMAQYAPSAMVDMGAIYNRALSLFDTL